MKAFFLSDIHLSDPSDSNSQKLLLFLSQLSALESTTHLFLVGDIFDLWIEDHQYFKKRYHKIIEAIRTCVEKGIKVHYFEGNHDLYLVKFWQQDVGARVHEGPKFFQLENWSVRVEHGDQMNPNDKGYIFLRWFLRTPLMVWVAKTLPGKIVSRIGESASQASRKHTGHLKEKVSDDRVKKMIRTYAKKMFQQKPFDFLISGHTHVKDEFDFEVDGQNGKSVNLGSWFDGPKVYVLDHNGGQFLKIPLNDD